MLVLLSLYVMLSILYFFPFWSVRPQVCSVLAWSVSRSRHHICHSWQHTGVVHLSLQADGKVAFEDIPVFGVCRPACHDSSLYIFVLVLFLEAVVLSQVHVACDIFYPHIVHVYRGVVYNHHLCQTRLNERPCLLQMPMRFPVVVLRMKCRYELKTLSLSFSLSRSPPPLSRSWSRYSALF